MGRDRTAAAGVAGAPRRDGLLLPDPSRARHRARPVRRGVRPGYGEENDYCLRIAAHGWLAKIANRALVLHAGGKSFAGNRSALRAAHQRELERRYPFLPDAVAAYQRHGTTATERFADVLVPAGPAARLAVDLRHVEDAAGLARGSTRPSGTASPWRRGSPPARRPRTAGRSPPTTRTRTTSSPCRCWSTRHRPTSSRRTAVRPSGSSSRPARVRPVVVRVVPRRVGPRRRPRPAVRGRGGPGGAGERPRGRGAQHARPARGHLCPPRAALGGTAPPRPRRRRGRCTRRRHRGRATPRELEDLRTSRSFRTGQAIAKVAARLPGRR